METITYTVSAYVDGVTENGTDTLKAEIVGNSFYTAGTPGSADVEINDPPANSTLVTMSASPTSLQEGGAQDTSTITFTRAGGDTTQELTINVGVDDLYDYLRGNQYDPPPNIPSEVIFEANSTTAQMTISPPDDDRDLPPAGLVTVSVLPGTGYLLGETGLETSVTLSVTDNDDAQVLSLNMGYIDLGDSAWEEGESWSPCTLNMDGDYECTDGPAEGIYYYEDARTFRYADEFEEPWPIHFEVSRRAQDTGNTATFVVRVEHNRRWIGPRHADWLVDPETGNYYKDFPLTLTGNQRKVIGRVEVTNNGLIDRKRWKYTASIRPLEDVNGVPLSPTAEGQYWKIEGSRPEDREANRTITVEPSGERGYPEFNIKLPDPASVAEGSDITMTIERKRGNPYADLPVQIRTWEPNQTNPDGTNPTEQVHDLVFPGVAVTPLFQRDLTQTIDLTVTATDDTDFELTDLLRFELISPKKYWRTSVVRGHLDIIDDDQPTITLTADETSITEGEKVTFTLTRGNNTAVETLVSVQVDDPGGFLQGDYIGDPDGVETPTSVMFADGEATKTVAITPPDDRRDISNSTLTFTVEADSGYEILGANTRTVQVVDNDVAPQVQIAFNHDEVEEGEELVMTITRIGEDKNDLEIPITGGRADDQQFMIVGLSPGQSEAHFRYTLPDDEVKGPEVEYSFTLQPGNPAFWVPTGNTTVTAKIVDNDPYRVSVRTFRASINEGETIYYRVEHDGYTDQPLQVKVEHSEEGNAVGDLILKEYTHTIPAGSSGVTRGFESQAGDGSDGDATFIVEIVEDDAYEIVTDRGSADVIVVDKDPLPVLQWENNLIEVSEGDGTVEHVIELVSDLPVLRDVTLEYQVQEQFASDGADIGIADTAMSLTIPAGSTSGTIEIPIIQDLVAESDETVYVYIRNPVHATLQDGVSFLRGWVIIEDDEPTVSLEAAQAAVNEGDDIVLELTRTGDTTDGLVVWLNIEQHRRTATLDNPQVTFDEGSDTATYTIETIDDSRSRGSYDVRASVASPGNLDQDETYHAAPDRVTVTVRDNDLPKVSIYTDGLRVTEGETISFTVARQYETGSALTVNLDVDETGSYTTGTIPTSVTIPALGRVVEVEIQTEDDSASEDTGELTVSIGTGTGYISAYPSSYTFGIFDNDSTLPAVVVEGDDEWVNEGTDVSFTFTRTGSLTDSLDARVRLYQLRSRVTAADLADTTREITSPADLIILNEEEITVTFPADTATVTLTRSTTDDTLIYGNSTYHAYVHSGPDDEYASRHNFIAQVWVQDDDRSEVSLSLVDDAYYTHSNNPYPDLWRFRDRFVVYFNVERTGDTSGQLRVATETSRVTYMPAPLEDLVSSNPNENIIFSTISPGESTVERGFNVARYVNSLGRDRTFSLNDPHYCPDEPAECGYGPQYTLGTSKEVTIPVHATFMGVGIEADQATVAEGGSATFTLHRQGGKPDALSRPLEVKVAVTQDGDYITGTTVNKVTFLANESTASVTVNTENDAIDEADGTITVTILAPDSFDDDEKAYETRQYPVAPWLIYSVSTPVTDDDYIPPNVSVDDALGKEQDGTIEFTVSLDAANNEEAATVNWATAEDGTDAAATSDTDFTAASGTVTFAIGETEKTVTVTLLDDEIDETHETFNLVLSSPHGATIADGTAIGTIQDDELATAVIFDSPVGDVVEGENVSLRVKRFPLANPDGAVSADDPCYTGGNVLDCFNTSPTAEDLPDALTVKVRVTEEGDVISGTAPTTVTFQAGSVYGFLEIPTVDDTTIEADGLVTVQVLNGSGYSPLLLGVAENPEDAQPTNTRTVYDNDLTFSISDASATEGTDTTLDFTVSLNAAAPQEYTVDVATSDGDATSHGNRTLTSLGRDFTATTQTITFALGEQSRTISVPIDDDTFQERSETFTATLSNPQGYSQLADASAKGTIIDDEEFLVASVSRTYSVVDEDQSGPVRFMVTLSHPETTNHERNPAAGWQTVAGTATGDEDYVTGSGKIVFRPGQTSGFLDVDIVDDKLVEAALETFSVELVVEDSRLVTLSSTDASYEASIRDNETLTASVIANQEYVVEGQDAFFTVRLAGGVTTEDTYVTFELTEGVAGEVYVDTDDYGSPIGNLSLPSNNKTGESGAVVIPAGKSSGWIIYPISEDDTEENSGNGERMELRIFSANDGLETRAISATEYKDFTTILDKGALTASIGGTPTVIEGGTATFTVSLSTMADEAVSVGWTTTQAGDTFGFGETAVPGADYTAATGTVAIQAGDTSGTFTVQTTDDVLVEESEAFLVHLDEVTKGSGTPPERVPFGTYFATGIITDNDIAPDGVTITATPRRVNENNGPTDITVTVSLDGTSRFTTDTPVTLRFIGRTATRDEDFTADNVDIVIPAGESSVTTTVTITLIDDNLLEENETIRISAVPTDLADSDHATIVILDDDLAPGELEVGISPFIGDESDGTIVVEVSAVLNGGTTLPADFDVELTTRGITATAGDDFETATTTITVPAGSRSAKGTLELSLLEDTLDEDNETLEIAGTVANAASLNLPPTFSVKPVRPFTILDNDAAPTGIGLSVTGNAVTEGGSSVSLTVRATLFGGGTRLEATTVTLEVVEITATVADDYTLGGAIPSITIPSGAFYGEATITIAPVQDSLYEGTEAIAVRGSNLTPGLPVSGVRLTIQDDDPAPTTVALSFSQETVSESAQSTSQNLLAELDGSSTLTQDLRIKTGSVKGSGNAARSANGNVTGNLVIKAGQSTAEVPVFIFGLNDDEDDDDETLEIDGSTNNPDISVTPARLTITDDDTAGLETSVDELIVPEGTSRTYSVRLNTKPTANVTITLSVPSNASFTATPGTLTFKPGNWSAWQTVTVTASTDLNGDDAPARNISHSTSGSDSKYRALSALTLPVTVRDNTSASITVTPTTLTVAEGSTGTYTVVLTMQPTGDVDVDITGTTGTDVSVDDDELTFTDQNWNTAQTVTVTAGLDSDSTDDTVTLTHTASGGGYGSADTVDVVVTVDDVGPAVTVEFGAATYSVDESDDSSTTEDKENEVVVTVKLSADPERTVTIPIVKADQGGATSADYSGVPASVTFNSGDTSKSFTFTATADTVDDDGESVKLTFGTTLPTGVTEGTTKQTIVSINDDDDPGVTVEFGAATYSVDESDDSSTTEDKENEAVVTVKLSADPERTVAIPITKANQGGATSADYSGVPASVTFNSGDTSKSFTFTATADTVDDDGESVKLTFGTTLPTGVTEGTTKQTIVSINDDDDPGVTVEFGAATYSVDETDDPDTTEDKENEVVVTVKLSADPERTVTIPIVKADQGGASSSDYSGVPANVVFNSGDTSKTFTFSATADTTDDDGEKVKLTFGTLPTGVSEGTTKQTVISINDDDATVQPQVSVTVSFGAGGYTVAESDDTTTTEDKENEVVVTVTLSDDPESTVTIPIVKANQGGASSADYSGVPASVNFNSGDTSKSFTFTATSDTVDDDDESVKLTFGTLPTGVTEGTTKETVVSITDDDDPSVTVEFGAATYSVDETDDASTTEDKENEVVVTVKLSADPERTVTIPISKANQGGASNSDYSGVPASVTFDSGDTSKTFTFSAASDTADDDGESVKLTFGTLPTGVTEGTTKETVVSITDDDDPSVTVEFGAATYSVDETDDASTTEDKENEVVVTVKLSADPERTVTIPISKANQGGASNSDYSGVPASVTFNSGDTSKTFTFSAASDTADDDGESVKLTFGTLPTGVTEGTTKETVVSITDDDDPSVTVEFGAATYSVEETDDSSTTEDKENEVVVTVKLSADPERTVAIPITKANQGGATSADYSGVPASVTFNSGDTEKSFTFSATDDSVDDDGESVKLTFGTLPTGVSEGTTKQTIVSINDDDATVQPQVSSVTVSYKSSAYSLMEGSTVIVTVRLSDDPERTVTIPVTTTNGTGVSDDDYSGVPDNVAFNSGDTEKTFAFVATQDSNDEDEETVTLGFGNMPSGVSTSTPAEAAVIIRDSLRVSFEASSYQATEGGSGADVTVKLDGAATADLVIPITATGMDGASSDDWTGAPVSLMFGIGDTEKIFTVMAYDDEVEDDGESVQLAFGNLPAGVVEGAPSTANVELMNTEVGDPPACSDAVWCANLVFADDSNDDWGRMGLTYHPTQNPGGDWSELTDNRSTISDDRFDFRGDEYYTWGITIHPGVFAGASPQPPGRVPDDAVFYFSLGRWDNTQRFSGSVRKAHYRDWILWVDGYPLPLSEASTDDRTFWWQDAYFQSLYEDWEEGDEVHLVLEEDLLSERPAPVLTMPSAPRYLEVTPSYESVLVAWREPLEDGNSPVTHYLVQWKLHSASWSDVNAVTEERVDPLSVAPTHVIQGLNNGTNYSFQVIAVNGQGASLPSNEHFGRPHAEQLRISRNSVDGDTITLEYERDLDANSVPDADRFRAEVNGGPREITSVSVSGRNVVLTLESAVNSADEVRVLYFAPSEVDVKGVQDADGQYAWSMWSPDPMRISENMTLGPAPELTAEFVDSSDTPLPSTHSGPTQPLRLEIEFSEPVKVEVGPAFAYLLEVTGGKVVFAWWVGRDTRVWEVLIVPDADGDITVVLPADRRCSNQGAPCASGERILTTGLEHTISAN